MIAEIPPDFISGCFCFVYISVSIHTVFIFFKNILICEFKGYWYAETNDFDTILEDDKKKIAEYCSNPYDYSLGVAVLLNKDSYEIKCYSKNGDEFNWEKI